jgi:uncharacterized membrane protein YfcA
MEKMEITSSLLLAAGLIALLCQYASVSMGIGYGTPLTPLLLILGFSPLQAVPAVLLSQLAGGMVGGLAHHRLGNIELDFRQDERLVKERLRGLGYLPRSIDSKVIFVLAICGIAGVLIGVFTAVNIPLVVLETYIGVMVLLIGLMVLLRRASKNALSWRTLVALGIVSAFNKGVSGGGYMPLVTGGQIISGREVKSSVGSTTVAVAIISAVGFLGYLLIKGNIYWTLVVATSIGSILAAPFAALTGKLRFTVGLATTILGASILAKTYIF